MKSITRARKIGRPPSDIETRFWSKVDTSGDCWLWTSTKYPNGRGQFKVANKNLKAYRVAYELEYGPIPEGLQVLHHCDNPSCVRPAHLFVGTCADNQADMTRKGRGRLGIKNGQYKHGRYVGLPSRPRKKVA